MYKFSISINESENVHMNTFQKAIGLSGDFSKYSEEGMRKDKVAYLEYIRIFSAIGVVFNHIVKTLPDNYTVAELGTLNYMVFMDSYILVKWAVPCFIMISGALLLDPLRNVDVIKTKKYIIRMFEVLLSFGFIYAFLELLFSQKRINIEIILTAFLNMAEGKTWGHMWYIYSLIPVYIIMIPLRDFIKMQNRRTVGNFTMVLAAGNFIIPSINVICGTDLETLMPLGYFITYFLIGYYISTIKRNSRIYNKILCISGLIVITLVMIGIETYALYFTGKTASINHIPGGILTLLQSVFMFLSMKMIFCKRNIGKLMIILSKYSFGIYLIHPFWINLIYKVLKITPLSMPIGIGIVVMLVLVFILSFVSAWIMKRIPIIKYII